MKKKYIIELDENPSCWEGCKFYDENEGECRVDREISPRDVSHYIDTCPLTELKPKELEWEDLEKYGISRAFKNRYGIEKSMPYNDPEWKVYNIYIDGNLKTTRDTLNDAKQYCQEEHNKLFYEMLGGKK